MTGDIRILVVEDHPLTADGIASVLEAAGMRVCGRASTGSAALEALAEESPDLVLVDLRLPDMSGIEIIRQTAKRHPTVKTVVFSMHEEVEYILRAARAGANGYVLKSADPADLVAAIRAVMAGQSTFPAEAARLLLDVSAGDAPRLTAREEEVVRWIAAGLVSREIAERLNLSVRTVETYRARAMKKLNLHTVADLTRYAIAQGLVET